jgi:glyoxylase-like metal-dependent hydrolase (beta-lactamase superfamily II)
MNRPYWKDRAMKEITPGLFLIDTMMSGRAGYTSVFVVKGKRAAILDSGVSVTARPVLDEIFKDGLAARDFVAVALTHAHYDHAGGARELLLGLREHGATEVKVACAEKPAAYLGRADICEKLLKSGKATEGALAGEMVPIDRDDFLVMKPGDKIDLGGLTLIAVDSPGHANGHLCFHVPELRFLFVGDACGLMARDAAGAPAILPTAFAPEYRHEQYLDTVRNLAGMDVKTMGFAHFGALENPRPALLKAIEDAGRMRKLAASIHQGAKSRDEVLDQLMEEYGPPFLSLYPSPERVQLTLKSLLAGMINDLGR